MLAERLPTVASTPRLPDSFKVVVVAREEGWVFVSSDGRTVYSGLLPTGAKRSVRGSKQVIVKAGNIGGVDLVFNGKKLPPQGEFGEVKTVTFGPAGMTAK